LIRAKNAYAVSTPRFGLWFNAELLRQLPLQMRCERFVCLKEVSYAGLKVTYHLAGERSPALARVLTGKC